MSGFTCSDPACGSTGGTNTRHSFVVSKAGLFTSFDSPGASRATTILPSGAVVGGYIDSSGVGHGYLLHHGTFSTISGLSIERNTVVAGTARPDQRELTDGPEHLADQGCVYSMNWNTTGG